MFEIIRQSETRLESIILEGPHGFRIKLPCKDWAAAQSLYDSILKNMTGVVAIQG